MSFGSQYKGMPLFTSSLKQNGHLDGIYMAVCNVGSRKMSQQDDYASLGWEIFAPNLTILGFDADEDACEAANSELLSRSINWKEKHLPLALGKTTDEKTLYVTQHPMCSSLYSPNEPFLNRFQSLPEFANLDYTIGIDVTTLDKVCQQENIKEIDFLQIDVQGADLDVLQGAVELLKHSVLAVQIEVEFSSLYVNQPLFADIDIFLRQRGFSLFHLSTTHRPRKISPLQSYRQGQLLWGDAFYFRDLIAEDFLTDYLTIKTSQNILKLACIADLLEFSDYTFELLQYLTLNYGQHRQYNFADLIVQTLSQFPNIVQFGLDQLEIVQQIQDYLSLDGKALLNT